MALRIGMHTGVQDVSYPDLRKLWQIADSNGFYWVSVWDHFYENPTQDGKSPCFEATTKWLPLQRKPKTSASAASLWPSATEIPPCWPRPQSPSTTW